MTTIVNRKADFLQYESIRITNRIANWNECSNVWSKLVDEHRSFFAKNRFPIAPNGLAPIRVIKIPVKILTTESHVARSVSWEDR